jgi:hypothetical protein
MAGSEETKEPTGLAEPAPRFHGHRERLRALPQGAASQDVGLTTAADFQTFVEFLVLRSRSPLALANFRRQIRSARLAVANRCSVFSRGLSGSLQLIRHGLWRLIRPFLGEGSTR